MKWNESRDVHVGAPDDDSQALSVSSDSVVKEELDFDLERQTSSLRKGGLDERRWENIVRGHEEKPRYAQSAQRPPKKLKNKLKKKKKAGKESRAGSSANNSKMFDGLRETGYYTEAKRNEEE